MTACELCGSKENLVGPYAGGPVTWYCKSCKLIVDRFLEAQKQHQKLIENLTKRREK